MRILFYRDGVGDGQIPYVHSQEVTRIKVALQAIYEQHGQKEVPFCYVIVTKRVNTRIFFDRRNPDPGTCVDDVITCPEKYVIIFIYFIYLDGFQQVSYFFLYSILLLIVIVIIAINYLCRYVQIRFLFDFAIDS